MKIQRVPAGQSANAISSLLDTANKETIGVINWPVEHPSCPKVEFAMLHDGDNVYIKYWVEEQATLAAVTEDLGQVWTDSCVEFFITFGTGYYNMEFNSIGYGLASFRTDRYTPEFATSDLMSKIERYPSLPREPFAEKSIDKWNIMLKYPKDIFFKENFETLDGVKGTANFYKCGDNLSVPHFVTWSPIKTEAPNFHLPSFFAEVEFCKE